MEGVPFLFQKASYMYKLIRNIDSSWYLLLFGTLDLLKILCLASLVKHRIARGLPRHLALMDGEVPHIVVACLGQGKTSGGQSLCTIFACLVFNAITFVEKFSTVFSFIWICWINRDYFKFTFT